MTRAERFDELVFDAVEHLDQRWSEELSSVEFAVEEVPIPADTIVLDGAEGLDGDDVIPLSRLMPPSGTGRDARPARIVVYRRPLEARATDREDLGELVLDVIIHEVARLLGVEPEIIDPEGHGFEGHGFEG